MKSLILDKTALNQKIKRLAYEIVEEYFEEAEICLVGIAKGGQQTAHLLANEITKITKAKVSINSLKINKENPVESQVDLSEEIEYFQNKVILIVDDVANSGRTLFYAFKPFLNIECKSLKVAALVDRKHKRFPVKCDFVGTSLNTTIKEHIEIVFTNDEVDAAYLV